MDDSRIRKASDLVGAILSPEIARTAGTWAGFFSSWDRAAGERLAAHSRPVDVKNGIVVVEAEHPGWIQLLQMQQDRILSSIAAAFPELGIKGIAFRLAGDQGRREASPAAAGSGQRTSPGCEESAGPAPAPETIRQTLDAVSDPGFRDILSSLADAITE